MIDKVNEKQKLWLCKFKNSTVWSVLNAEGVEKVSQEQLSHSITLSSWVASMKFIEGNSLSLRLFLARSAIDYYSRLKTFENSTKTEEQKHFHAWSCHLLALIKAKSLIELSLSTAVDQHWKQVASTFDCQTKSASLPTELRMTRCAEVVMTSKVDVSIFNFKNEKRFQIPMAGNADKKANTNQRTDWKNKFRLEQATGKRRKRVYRNAPFICSDTLSSWSSWLYQLGNIN